MKPLHRAAGIVLGLILAGVVLSMTRTPERTSTPSGPILSECDGRLREVVIHYAPASREVVETVYREFVSALDSEVAVHVVCPDTKAFDDFTALLGPVRCRLNPVAVNHSITTWSRDRWVALQAAGSTDGPVTLLAPRSENGSDVWPQRAGDERVAHDLARMLPSGVRARRSGLVFDGGDFLADDRSVFVMPRVLRRNLQRTISGREDLVTRLGRQLNREVILLEEAPDHHAAMFMAVAGNGTVLVGDPRLAESLLPSDIVLPGGPDLTVETQGLFDAVADQCRAAGYRVRRVPTLPAMDGRTFLTYVNVLLDERRDRRIAYVPVYRGAEALNTAGRAAWEALGYEVRPIDCTSAFRHFGCLHCLVNVIKRE